MSDRVATRAPRLLLLGYQGFGNLGDEAILTGIEALLAGRSVQIEGIVCGPRVGSIAAFAEARRLPTARLLPGPSALRALWRSDALILTGGGLIHDHWATIIPRYLGWIVLARALGKRVIWLGVGVGPIRRRSQRLLARVARSLTILALVRDRASAALLGGPSGRVAVIPDPALFNSPPPVGRTSGDEVAIIVRGPTPERADEADRLAATLAETHRVLAGRGLRAVSMTMAGASDVAFLRLLRARAAELGSTVEVEELGPTPGDAIARLAGCRAAISVRLHGLLLSTVAGIPCVAVAYDGKVSAAADELGIAELAVDPFSADAEGLVARLELALDLERRARLADRVAELRSAMPAIAERVLGAVGSRR